ncbi:MAG TPA: 3-deoxy-manno-octulosonate cytidylyltransferase [Gemmataceae bacterium]|nr:3-deoxy-manno-octulosonate cytidylyltransferase [Gemmataceae bacterium]
MDSAIVIPARYASTRLRAKPLLRSTGKYLIQHVYERASQSRRSRLVLVATDDPRVVAAVQSFGGDVVLTRDDHASGSDRVAEVARDLDVDVVINLQGDEPEIEPEALDLLPELLERDPDAVMATLATPITDRDRWLDPNCVKVVCDDSGRALYFSRAPIPHSRDCEPDFSDSSAPYLQHVGVYAYRREFLLQLSNSPPSSLECLEKLEQLRVLSLGYRIAVGRVPEANSGVDTLHDYEAFVRRYRKRPVRAVA